MKKTVFLTDLDNTLVYSYKHAKADDICVEIAHDKPQGFISERGYALLKTLTEHMTVIPVTTRSTAQYERIRWENPPKYAAVANGGILLDGGESDGAWRKETETLIAAAEAELSQVEKQLAAEDNYIRIRRVDDTYVFAYTKEGVDIAECEKRYSGRTSLQVTASGRKLYFFPQGIDKGEAAKRLKARFQAERVIAAGDSVIDLPMLAQADVAIVPNGYLAKRLPQSVEVKVCDRENFAEYVLETALAYIERLCHNT